MAGGKKMRMNKDPRDNPPAAPKPPPPPTPFKLEVKAKSEREVAEIMDSVWSNDMLRDKILEHVIYPVPPTSTSTSLPEINYRDVPNLRLVQKSWLLSTSHILRQNRHPLYHLHKTDTLRFFLAHSADPKKFINSLIQTMTRPRRLEPFLPTFRLSLNCSFFIPEHHKILSDFFEKCGSGLVSLKLVIPKSCSMSFVFPPLSLDILQQLTIEFVSHSHNESTPIVNPSFLENSSVTYFIQHLMNSTSELKTLEVKYPSSSNTDSTVIPHGFQHLSLPPTVSTLLLRGPFSAHHLEITKPRNAEAHLKALQIRISQATPVLDENTINKVLERHGTTLQSLKLCGGKISLQTRVNHQNREPSLFKIPPMRNLKEITLSSPSWITANDFYMTPINFPNLSKFKMKGISVNLFERITTVARRLRLKSVKSLEIWLINQLTGFTFTLNGDQMERAHRTFCGVTTLEITICGMEASGMKYIFREMGKLKSLAINVRKSIAGNDMTCETFEGLLIGMPEWIAKGLRETPDYWEFFKGRIGYDDNPSIMKLKGLTKLTLATREMGIHYLLGRQMRNRMISEVALHFALCKMPALKTLQLFGRFQPTQQMIELWRTTKQTSGQGGTLLYGVDRKDGKEN